MYLPIYLRNKYLVSLFGRPRPPPLNTRTLVTIHLECAHYNLSNYLVKIVFTLFQCQQQPLIILCERTTHLQLSYNIVIFLNLSYRPCCGQIFGKEFECYILKKKKYRWHNYLLDRLTCPLVVGTYLPTHSYVVYILICLFSDDVSFSYLAARGGWWAWSYRRRSAVRSVTPTTHVLCERINRAVSGEIDFIQQQACTLCTRLFRC